MAPEVWSQIGHGSCVDWWALGILIFEMLAFEPPFGGCSTRDTAKNVLDRDPRCPQHFGSVTKGIVYLLLIKDQTLRLGSGADGSGRVMSHPWFSAVDWSDLLLQRCNSPFLQGVRGDGGAPACGIFPGREADDRAAGGLREVDARAAGGLTEAQQQLFADF